MVTLATISLVAATGRWAGRQNRAAAVAEPARPLWTTQDNIIALQDHLRLNPEAGAAYAQLGLAWLQQVRETGDAAGYDRAEQAFTAALARNPAEFEAMLGQGLLALARHDFDTALAWGERARTINPYRAQVYGLIGDAQIELGRYAAAHVTLQRMVDIRPDLSSYSRVSYLRELHGDTAGAIQAMQLAVAAGSPTAEGTLWAQVQLGHLYFNSGDLAQAERAYRQALNVNREYVHALAGLARLQAAQGQDQAAIAAYQRIVERLPWPEYLIALGELYELSGQPAAAQTQYELVQVIARLNQQAGMKLDLELALFNADHGRADPAQTVAGARTAYAERPSLYAADALAWALFHQGQYAEAFRYSRQALRLGTRDAVVHFHAGMIAAAAGRPGEARQHWQQALTINPYFSRRYAPQARALLAESR
jgi:tetratricopeptide (TPR) repeat protein